jgi:hypothetical protein
MDVVTYISWRVRVRYQLEEDFHSSAPSYGNYVFQSLTHTTRFSYLNLIKIQLDSTSINSRNCTFSTRKSKRKQSNCQYIGNCGYESLREIFQCGPEAGVHGCGR